MTMRFKLIFPFAAMLFACSTMAQTTAPIKLTYAAYNGSNTATGRTGLWFMDEVTARSGGRVKFETYFSGSLLNAPDLYPGLARGAVDIAEGAPQGYNGKDYSLTALTLPYITDKFDAVTYAFKELYAASPYFRQEYEGKGIRMLYAMSFGENTLWTNKRVQTRADLKGKRLRALTSIGVAFQELGATIVPMPFPDTPEALKRGTIDGVTAAPFDASILYGFHKIAPFVSDAGRMGVNAAMIVSMNQKKLDSLPPDIRRTILEVADEAPKQYIKIFEETVQASAERFAAESNAQVVQLSDAETKAWRDATILKLREKWLATTPDPKQAGQLLDQFAELVRKYERSSNYVTGLDRYRKMKGL